MIDMNSGTVYFVAHAVDVLLYQNPDLFHDLYVFKCITTVVFTSGSGDNEEFLIPSENGLGHAYLQMAGVPVNPDSHFPNATTVQIGEREIVLWSPQSTPNIRLLYLRLPDGGHTGQGRGINGGESLAKLRSEEVKTITTVDGNATYTLNELKDLIAVILSETKAKDIRMLHHKASLPEDETDADTDHADHTTSTKLVMDVIERDNITANIQL